MARDFDATSSQSIAYPSAASINLGSGDYTVMVWVRFPAEPPDNSMIVGKRAGGFDGDEGWELKFQDASNGTIRWDHQTDITGRQRAEADIPTITNGSWHLLAGDHSDTANQLRIWYDGAIVATKSVNTPGSVDTTTPMVVGAAFNAPNTNYLTGEIGPVFVAKRVFSLAEHQMLAAGVSPRFLRPLPDFVSELIGRGSPEIDIASGLLGALENAPGVAINPRLIFPVSPLSAPDVWYEFANATIDGQSSLAATLTRGRQAEADSDGQSSILAVATRGRTAPSQVDGQSTLTAFASELVPVDATISGQSAIVADLSPDAPIEAAVTAQSTISASVAIDAIVGAIPIRGQSGIVATLGALVPATSTVAGQSSVVADIAPRVPIAAQSDGQSALTADANRGRTISASIGGQSGLTADTTIDAGVVAQIDAQSGLVSLLSATVPVAAVCAPGAGLVADISASVPAATTIGGQSAATATATRGQPVEATVDGQSTLVVDTTAWAPASTTIAATSTVTASTVAIVRPVVGIDAEAFIRARPSYPGVKKTITTGGVAKWLRTVGGFIRQ